MFYALFFVLISLSFDKKKSDIFNCVAGFNEIKAACCGLGNLKAQVPCVPISTYCSNRKDHVFWDLYHPTEATARIFVDTLFDGPSQYNVPMNLRQLVSA